MRQFNTIFTLSLLLLVSIISGCQTAQKESQEVSLVTPPQSEVISAEPILTPTKQDKMFAQTALNQLGYKLGPPDAIWGKRSIKAINAFHADNNMAFTNGKITTLDMSEFETRTQLSYDDFAISTSLLNKLDVNIPLSKGPQLIILDKNYPMLAKANPYSELLLNLEAGTGIYIIGHQLGWIEVESLSRQRGFIKDQ